MKSVEEKKGERREFISNRWKEGEMGIACQVNGKINGRWILRMNQSNCESHKCCISDKRERERERVCSYTSDTAPFAPDGNGMEPAKPDECFERLYS